jgi:asparagine synthase (glutamine-hydrolysing)
MCGIAGVAGVKASSALLECMGSAIAHRGPDDVGELVRSDVGFAFRRLSIIDRAGGNQPIFNEDGSVAIMLNGEIYNHHQLRADLQRRGHRFRTRSDVETVVHLWEDHGEDCLKALRGMFALAIWDERTRTLFLARDRVGKKPLYFHRFANGGIAFGSEIKAILQHPDVPREVNLPAIDLFLSLQYVPSPMTAFRGIERLPPGHWLRWRDGQVEVRRYWELDFAHKFEAPEAELREELVRLLRESVRIRLESEVPLGAFLSGGIDSSAVVALAAEASSTPLKTFSIGFQTPGFDESRYARLVATRFATEHHELVVTSGVPEMIDDIVWHYDQPFGDSSAIPSFQVARLTRPYVTVVLNGDGGDEAFAGYDRYRLSRYGAFFHLPPLVRQGLFGAVAPVAKALDRARRLVELRPNDAAEAYYATLIHLSPRQKHWLYRAPFLQLLVDQASPPLDFLRRQRGSLLGAMLATDVNHYLPDDLLVKMDVATMAYSLEGRSPFLDHRLMEFMARVPDHMKLRGRESKHLLKVGLKGILPDEILRRRKMGFGVPLAAWLREDLKPTLLDTLTSTTAIGRGYFRPAAIEAMLKAHFNGSNRFRYILWDLLMLELWHRRFVDRPPTVAPARSSGAARTARSDILV